VQCRPPFTILLVRVRTVPQQANESLSVVVNCRVVQRAPPVAIKPWSRRRCLRLSHALCLGSNVPVERPPRSA
jgi:hypothetical protein